MIIESCNEITRPIKNSFTVLYYHNVMARTFHLNQIYEFMWTKDVADEHMGETI
jgi:hypothetical protein